MELFNQFPKIRLKLDEIQEIVPKDEQSKYPAFQADFAILEAELMNIFRSLDNKARRYQNLYRGLYVIVIFGGMLVTILGIIQFVADSIAIGILTALVAAVVSAAALILRSFHYHENYLNARLAAEALRGEYFLFLGHQGFYADEQDRITHLRERVIEISIKGKER